MILLLPTNQGHDIMNTPNPEQGRMLILAVMKLMQQGGGELVMIDAEDRMHEWEVVRLGPYCFIRKPPVDRLPRRIDGYRIAPDCDGIKFKIDPQEKLFSLHYEAGDSGLHLVILKSIESWLAALMQALVLALMPQHAASVGAHAASAWAASVDLIARPGKPH